MAYDGALTESQQRAAVWQDIIVACQHVPHAALAELRQCQKQHLLSQRRRITPRPRDDPRLLVCPLEGCEVKDPRYLPCPAHCTNASCPTRGKGRPLLPWLRRNMRVVWSLLSPHPLPASSRQLLLITISFPHTEQLVRLQHCAIALAAEPNVLWIVVEDSAARSPDVASLLERSGIRHVHLAHGPTRHGGNAQRNEALKYLRDHRVPGVVYNLDDDNGYHPRLWNALRSVGDRRVGVLAVRRGVFPPPRCDGRFLPLIRGQRRTLKVERPVYDNVTGRFARFEAGWCLKQSWMSRKYGPRTFCVDMAGFAFDASLLLALEGEIWTYQGHGGESEFITKLLGAHATPEDLQPLANCGQDVCAHARPHIHTHTPIWAADGLLMGC